MLCSAKDHKNGLGQDSWCGTFGNSVQFLCLWLFCFLKPPRSMYAAASKYNFYWNSAILTCSFSTIIYCLILLEVLPILLLLFSAYIWILHEIGVQHKQLCEAYILIRNLNVLEFLRPNDLRVILTFRKLPSPKRGVRNFIKQILALP